MSLAMLSVNTVGLPPLFGVTTVCALGAGAVTFGLADFEASVLLNF
jgi:hypothetical protein